MTAKKIKKILVPLDGSKNSIRGLDNAIYLARQCSAIITGLYILPVPAVYALHPIGFIKTELNKEAKNFLNDAKKRCAKKGILFNFKIIGGDPGYDIVRFSNNKKFDLVVIGARGRSHLKQVFLGSVSNYVLHKSKMPVLIVK